MSQLVRDDTAEKSESLRVEVFAVHYVTDPFVVHRDEHGYRGVCVPPGLWPVGAGYEPDRRRLRCPALITQRFRVAVEPSSLHAVDPVDSRAGLRKNPV